MNPSDDRTTYGKVRKVLFNEISLVLAVVGATVAVINYFQVPAVDNQKNIELIQQEIASQKELSDQINNLRDNHIHTLEVKIDDTNSKVDNLENEIIEVKTILNERLPNKR